ncbi:hypothetical protein B1R32_10574 [Abditibacterium utsteinense]|uniref:Uncharacterized protein n=1 Tax=Abditibacterium utsteinense TaxID=1960156 RepID=A0A2S8SUB8_9BACT|nr:hypothetical protein [Abditibacterium utsteinense]PQV64393.1 hypothetical protein B1R32_10574 [Abditibacterium utsteinense]
MKSQFTWLCGALLITPFSAWAQDAALQAVPATPATTLAVPWVQIPFPTPPAPTKVPSGLADIIRAKFPLSIGFEDLGAGWRVLNWNGQNYFTKGDATFLSEVEHLVVYRESAASVRALSAHEYALYATRNVLPTRSQMRFALSLLPMREVQSNVTRGATNLKSFDLADYQSAAFVSASQAFSQNLSLVYLRKIGEAMSAFSAANLDTLPPMDTAFEARQNLESFSENAAIFIQPGTNSPFKFNPILSGRKRAHLRGKSLFIIAYEGEAASDGSRAILRLNGRVARVSDKMWQQLKESSKIE